MIPATVAILMACLNNLGADHDPCEWKVFIYFSTANLKAVLLHSAGKMPSAHVEYAVG